MNFRFETNDVPVPASRWVQDRLAEKRGGWVFGRMGTGKSHAVRKAVEGGIRVDVSSGPLLGQRFAVDLARQIGAEGRPLLEAFRSEGLEASLQIADQTVNGHPFVVDGIDRLLPATSSLDDPAATLWQDERQALLAWLKGRIDRSPTFLVGRRHPRQSNVTTGLAWRSGWRICWPHLGHWLVRGVAREAARFGLLQGRASGRAGRWRRRALAGPHRRH